MKNIILPLLFTMLNTAFADCVLQPLSLKDRVQAAELIVEAKVSSKTSYWNAEHSMIFTSNIIEISSVLKGNSLISASQITITTSGGVVGNQAVKVDPELELEVGEIGIFLLIQKQGEWLSESGPQGFIKIDKHTAEASDVFNQYAPFSIQGEIQKITGLTITDINALLTKININVKRAAPLINSFSPNTLNAGTSTVLSIKGANFGSNRDSNSVQFRNADDGGLSYTKALKNDYISWTDTMIQLIVRTKAGTGKFRVVAGSNGVVVASDTLKIEYAHLNVVSGDTSAFETRQIGMNNNNGITWRMNSNFYDSIGARTAFIRSLEKWRCGTYINWDTLGRVNHSAIKSDGVNMCAWDTSSSMPSGVLAQCFSFWSGCFTPGLKWYVNELDIRFRVKPTGSTNWNYSSSAPQSNQFHFETVATHELGHGHQLGHVINKKQVMHYSIANGQIVSGLSNEDIDGGDYVINKSNSTVCGKNAHTKLNSGNCALVAPAANFNFNLPLICKDENITFTDSSLGNISNYAWNFGSGAVPATANTKGPHIVKYTSGGTKNISLTITTIHGNLVSNKSVQVKNDSKMKADFSFQAAEKGRVSFTNNANNPSSNIWYFGDGDSSILSSPEHVFNSGGTFNVKLVSTNTCNSNDSTKPVTFSYLNFGVNKNAACINETVSFIDSSDNIPATYFWNFTGGVPATASGKGPHQIFYQSSGNRSATLTISVNGAPNQQYTINNILTINTDTLTQANFNYSYYGKQIVGFQNLSKGSNLSYKWYFGDGDSSSEKNPIHTYNSANNQVVRLVVMGNCGQGDTTITLRDFTGIQTPALHKLLTVYPNPAQHQITLKHAADTEFEIEIYDMHGKLLLLRKLDQETTLDIKNLASGTYLIKASSNTGIETVFLIIQ